MIPAQRFQNEVHESTRWHGLTFAAGPLPISQQHAALRRGMRDFVVLLPLSQRGRLG